MIPFCRMLDELSIESYLTRFARLLPNTELATTDAKGEARPMLKLIAEIVDGKYRFNAPHWPNHVGY